MHAESRDCIDEIMNSVEIVCEEQFQQGKKRLAQPPREPSEPPPYHGSSSHSGTHVCELSCEEYNRTSWGGRSLVDRASIIPL